jgi:DNA-nicking Smr family endonuclease
VSTVTISDEDRKAFERATADVRRLKPANRASLDPPRPKPQARFSRAANAAVLEESLSDPTIAGANAEVAYRREQVPLRTFKRLQCGEFAIEAEIDLHGMRLDQARTELRDFIAECAARRLGCVRVIHGKGSRSGPAGPILKPSVHHWLARWDPVLAFVSAQTRHGGSGAVYVLLKSR